MIERLMRWITKRYIMGSMAHEWPDRRIDLFQMLHEATAAEFTEDNTYTRTFWLKEMIDDTDPRQGRSVGVVTIRQR